jgi:bacterial/archaeal transporter family-2 protein
MLNLLFAALAIAAGATAAIQSAANAGLKAHIGLGNALLVNTTVVLIGTIVLWVAMGAQTTFFHPDAPWTLYVGGVCGFATIAALALTFPKLGAAWAIAMMVLGQGIAALAIDHFGLLGMPRDPLTATRLLGVALVAAGVVVMRIEALNQLSK